MSHNMNKKFPAQAHHQQLLNEIAMGQRVRNPKTVAFACDLMVMTYSRCCMTERLACWDNFYLKMVDQFRVICAEGIPSGQPKLREKWFNLTIEEQLNLVLGAWDQPEIQPCACSVPRSTPTDLITSYLGVQ